MSCNKLKATLLSKPHANLKPCTEANDAGLDEGYDTADKNQMEWNQAMRKKNRQLLIFLFFGTEKWWCSVSQKDLENN